MELNQSKELNYACETCEETVPMESKDYHEQYLCARIMKAKQQEKQAIQNQAKSKLIRNNKNKNNNNNPQTTNQALLPNQSPEHQKQVNNTQAKIVKNNKNNKQNQMDFLKQMIPFIKKTNSDVYEELNQEEKRGKVFVQEEERQKNEGESKLSRKYEEKRPSSSRMLSESERQQRRSKLNQLIKKKSAKLPDKSNLSRIQPNKSRLAAPAPRRISSIIKDNKVECTSCQQMISLQKIDDHELSCGMQVDCEFCGLPLQLAQIEEHDKVCEIKEMWEQEQRREMYLNGEYDDDDGSYDDEYQREYDRYSDYKYHNYQHNHHQLEQQQDYWGKQSKKHKGLSSSKLASLSFSAYRKQSNSIQNHKHQKQQASDEQPCAICYLAFQESETIVRLPCLHTFHPECVGKWFEGDDRCPMCKVKVK